MLILKMKPKQIILSALFFSLTFLLPTEGLYTETCEGSTLDDVEGGIWECSPDPVVYGTSCELSCSDQYSIPEGDYLVTCTPEGWLPDPTQVSCMSQMKQ